MGSGNDLKVAHGFFDALGRGDRDAVLAVVTRDAVLWQNYDGQEKRFADRVSGLMRASQVADGFRYAERQYLSIHDGLILQHRLQGEIPGGDSFDAPIMVRVYMRDGRMARFEEYFDQQTLAPLYRAMGE